MDVRLEKEEDIDIKNKVGFNLKNSVSKSKFFFQGEFICFKVLFCAKISENSQFCHSPGIGNAAYIENGVGGISVFLLAAIIGGENIYRNVCSKSERIHEN